MVKDINYYLALPYTRELIPEPEGGWFVCIKELPGCMSQGDTPEEAIRMIDDAMRGWLEVELEDGEPIPEPRLDDDYSGKFVVRVPKPMHRTISEKADEDGVSINQWINNALAYALGKSPFLTGQEKGKSEETWPGLGSVAKDLLKQIAFSAGIDIEEMDERLFAGWFTQNLSNIESSCENGDLGCALTEIASLLEILSPYRMRSPAVSAILDSLKFLKKTLNQLQEAKSQLEEASQVKTRIRELLEIENIQPTHAAQEIIFDTQHTEFNIRPKQIQAAPRE